MESVDITKKYIAGTVDKRHIHIAGLERQSRRLTDAFIDEGKVSKVLFHVEQYRVEFKCVQ